MTGEYWDKKRETMKRNELEKLQLKLLIHQIKRCYNQSGFYRMKFKKAGVRPSDIKSLDDFSKVPFLFKGELREEQRTFGIPRYVVASGDLIEAYATSGTTGVSVLSFWTRKDRDYIIDLTARTLWAMGVRPGFKVQNAFSYELWPPGLSVHQAVQRIGGFVLPIGSGKNILQIKFLTELQPDVLVSTPSQALRIGNMLHEMRINPSNLSLKIGAFGGEVGAAIPSTRKKIEYLLDLEAYDYYGIIEIGPTFAGECKEKAGLHWSEDCHLIEVVDPKTGERVSEGEKGILVITHLTKEATPMIRYWTGDITEIEYEKCGCGRTHARSPRGILGRTDDMIIYQGINFYPSDIEEILRSFPELGSEYVIYFEETNEGEKCIVEVEYNSAFCDPNEIQSLKDRVAERIYDAIGLNLSVRIVDKVLSPHLGSKVKRFLYT
jgi:phenylacetate-CoA ligase